MSAQARGPVGGTLAREPRKRCGAACRGGPPPRAPPEMGPLYGFESIPNPGRAWRARAGGRVSDGGGHSECPAARHSRSHSERRARVQAWFATPVLRARQTPTWRGPGRRETTFELWRRFEGLAPTAAARVSGAPAGRGGANRRTFHIQPGDHVGGKLVALRGGSHKFNCGGERVAASEGPPPPQVRTSASAMRSMAPRLDRAMAPVVPSMTAGGGVSDRRHDASRGGPRTLCLGEAVHGELGQYSPRVVRAERCQHGDCRQVGHLLRD